MHIPTRIPAAPRRGLVLIIGFLAAASAIIAQDAAEDETIYELSPFEVSTEFNRGYLAGNAISAYRVNTPIKDIPFNIQIMTQEFIEDTQAVSLENVLQYAAGVTRQQSETEEGRFNIRGLQAGFPKRNGYRRYYAMDMTNVERVEVVKGPLSAIFGEAQPGGIINYITKKPVSDPRYHVKVTHGSYDFFRGQVGLTGPLNRDKNVLYRVDASYLDRGGFRDFEYEERTFVAPVLQWNPTPRTVIRADFEYLHKRANIPSFSPVWNETAFEAYLDRYSSRVLRDVFAEEVPPYFTDIATHFPREFSTAGPEAFSDFLLKTYTLEVTHKINSIFDFRAVASASDTEWEELRARPNRTRTSGFGFLRGHFYRESLNEVVNVQGDLTASFRTGPVEHRLTVGVEFFGDAFKLQQFRNPPPSQLFYYYDEAFMRSFFDTGVSSRGTYREYAIDMVDFSNPIGQQNTERDLYGIYFSEQMTLFNDRLRLIGGLRYDEVQQDFYSYDGSTKIGSDPKVTATTPQIGFNFAATNALNVYGNYSESFVPAGGSFQRLNEDGQSTTSVPKPPEVGTGWEVGVKGSLWENRLAFTFAYFDIDKTDVTANRRTDSDVLYNVLIDSITSSGFEADIFISPVENWQIMFGYAFMDSFQKDPDAIAGLPELYSSIPGVPRNQATLWTKYRVEEGRLQGLSIGGGGIWLDERRGSATIPDAIRLPSNFKADLFLQYAFEWKGVDYSLTLNVDNLFDEVYYAPGPRIELPRNYKLSLEARF